MLLKKNCVDRWISMKLSYDTLNILIRHLIPILLFEEFLTKTYLIEVN
jgi:hypothetical protein